MKKFVALIFVCCLLFCGTAFADGVKTGVIGNTDFTSEEISKAAQDFLRWSVLEKDHDKSDTFVFYGNFQTLLMALNKGEINEITLPRMIAEYAVNTNPDYKITCVRRTKPAHFAFGFLKGDGIILQKNFNYALRTMKKDGTLEALKKEYFDNAGKTEPKHVKFNEFKNADTVKVAVTGDMPPVDYIAPDGMPAGFNTAILAEIGRRLKINIETVNIEASSRSAALASKRVDVVFWYCLIEGTDYNFDIPENVIISEPYYDWDMLLDFRKK